MVEMIRKAALTDKLTGLYNRSSFDKIFRKLLCSEQPFSIIMMDINGLKYVNDHFGHEQVDKLILQAVENITGSVRKADYVFRFGGDEFIVLVNEDNPEIISAICLRIAEKNKEPKANRPLGVNLSIGACSSSEVTKPEDVFACADERMYQDKRRFYEQAGKFIKRNGDEETFALGNFEN